MQSISIEGPLFISDYNETPPPPSCEHQYDGTFQSERQTFNQTQSTLLTHNGGISSRNIQVIRSFEAQTSRPNSGAPALN
jgi:hypothetical protein